MAKRTDKNISTKINLPERECHVLFRTKSSPEKWRKGMFYKNGTVPVFASYGSHVNDIIEWKYYDDRS